MPTRNIRDRLAVEITHEQRLVLNKYLGYGEQRRVFNVILTDMTMLLNEYGYDFVTFLLQREFSYRKMMEDYANRRIGSEEHSRHDN